MDFGRIGRDQIRRLENFPLQPSCNVNPTSESDVIPTSHWRQMSAGLRIDSYFDVAATWNTCVCSSFYKISFNLFHMGTFYTSLS